MKADSVPSKQENNSYEKIFFEFFKTFLFIFIFFAIIILLTIIFAFIILLTNILFPNVAYAMEPSKDFVVDYYSDVKEYIGTDAYGYFNNNNNAYARKMHNINNRLTHNKNIIITLIIKNSKYTIK